MDIKYISGLFDGEGSIFVSGNEYLTITITNSHKGIIQNIHKITHGSFLYDKGKGQSTPTYRVYAVSNDANLFLNMVKDYLVIKKEQAVLALDYFKTKDIKFRDMIVKSRYNVTNEVSNFSLEYLAGLIDAEGHITIIKQLRKNRPSPHYIVELRITNSHIGILKSIERKFGGFMHIRKERVNLQTYDLIFAGSIKANNVLKAVLPYLIIKREEAQLALSFPQSPSRQPLTEQQIKEKDMIRDKIISLHGSKY